MLSNGKFVSCIGFSAVYLSIYGDNFRLLLSLYFSKINKEMGSFAITRLLWGFLVFNAFVWFVAGKSHPTYLSGNRKFEKIRKKGYQGLCGGGFFFNKNITNVNKLYKQPLPYYILRKSNSIANFLNICFEMVLNLPIHCRLLVSFVIAFALTKYVISCPDS